jgi:hypothetical protein
MKKMLALGMIVIVAVFSVPVAPAFAGEPSVGQGAVQFRALSTLPGELTALTDEQLSAVEGNGGCFVCINAARIRQTNVAAFSTFTWQSNTALVAQSNN